jgi:hypothetical protein
VLVTLDEDELGEDALERLDVAEEDGEPVAIDEEAEEADEEDEKTEFEAEVVVEELLADIE